MNTFDYSSFCTSSQLGYVGIENNEITTINGKNFDKLLEVVDAILKCDTENLVEANNASLLEKNIQYLQEKVTNGRQKAFGNFFVRVFRPQRIRDLDTKIEGLSKKISGLQEQKTKSLEQQIEELTSANKQLAAENKQCKTTHEESIQEIQKEKEGLTQKIASLEQKIKKLTSAHKQLAEENNQGKTTHEESIQKSQKEKEELEKNIASLEQQIQELTSEKEQLDQQLKKTKQEANQTAQDLVEAKQWKVHLDEDIATNKKLKQQLQQKQKELQKVQEKLVSETEWKRDLEGQLEQEEEVFKQKYKDIFRDHGTLNCWLIFIKEVVSHLSDEGKAVALHYAEKYFDSDSSQLVTIFGEKAQASNSLENITPAEQEKLKEVQSLVALKASLESEHRGAIEKKEEKIEALEKAFTQFFNLIQKNVALKSLVKKEFDKPDNQGLVGLKKLFTDPTAQDR